MLDESELAPEPEETPQSINHHLALHCKELQFTLHALQTTHQRLILDLYRIANALGVEEEGLGELERGIAPATIMQRIEELKREKP